MNLVFQRPSKKGIKLAMKREEDFITGDAGLAEYIIHKMKPVQSKFDKEKYQSLLKSDKDKEKEEISKKQQTLDQLKREGKKLQYLVLKK